MNEKTGRDQSSKELAGRLPGWQTTLFVVGLVAAILSLSQSASAQGSGYPMMNYEYPPYAQNDYSMTMQGMPRPISVLWNDAGMTAALDPASVEIIDEPMHGLVSIDPSSGGIVYVPDPDFFGIDDFTYVVSDMDGLVSNVATVSIFVIEDIPVIQSFTAAPSGNAVVILSGQVSDVNPGGITVTFGGLASGTVTTQADGSFQYTASVPSGTSGVVTAEAANVYGNDSSIVNAYVFNR